MKNLNKVISILKKYNFKHEPKVNGFSQDENVDPAVSSKDIAKLKELNYFYANFGEINWECDGLSGFVWRDPDDHMNDKDCYRLNLDIRTYMKQNSNRFIETLDKDRLFHIEVSQPGIDAACHVDGHDYYHTMLVQAVSDYIFMHVEDIPTSTFKKR